MDSIKPIAKENIATRRDQLNAKTPLLWTNLVKSPSEITATATVENNLMSYAILANQKEIMTQLGIGENFTAIA